MRLGDKRIFRNYPEKIKEMVKLRNSGWSWLKLAKKYECDHTSLIYQYRRYYETRTGKKRKPREEKVRLKEGHCPKCELLFKSEFSCDYCKDLPEKKYEKNQSNL